MIVAEGSLLIREWLRATAAPKHEIASHGTPLPVEFAVGGDLERGKLVEEGLDTASTPVPVNKSKQDQEKNKER